MGRSIHLLRRGLRLLALLVVTALLAVVAIVWLALALSRGWERDRLRTLVEKTADRELALHGLEAKLRIGALEGPLLPTLALRDVSLQVAGETVARAGRIDLRIGELGALRERRLVLERIEVEEAELALRRDPERGWPWDAWRPDPTPRLFALEIRSLGLAPAQLVLDFEDAGQASRLAGALEAQASGLVIPRQGDVAWPNAARLRWRLASSTVAGRSLRSADLAFVLEGSALRVATATLDADFGRARLDATADLAGWMDRGLPAALSLECDARELDLGVLLARPLLAGALSGRVTARVERRAGAGLRDAQAELAAELGPSRVGRLEIESAELRGTLGGGRFELARALVESSLGRLSASARGSFERADALDLRLELPDLAALAALLGRPGALGGEALLAARLAGPWADPLGEASLQASQLRVDGARLGSLVAGLRTEARGRLVLDPLRLAGGDWPLAAEGPLALRRAGWGVRFEAARLRLLDQAHVELAGGLDRHGAQRLRIELQALPLARVAALVGGSEALAGRLDARLALDGAWPRPSLQGSLDWDTPRVGEARAERLEASFATARGALQGEATLQSHGQRVAVARFTTPWDEAFDPASLLERPATRVSAQAHDLDLAFLGGVVPPTVRGLHGRADLELELTGAAPEPALSARLALADVGFELPALGQRLGPIAGRLTLAGDTLRVESLRLAGGEAGEALLAGNVALEGLAPASADLALTFHRFSFQYGGRLRADLEGRVGLAGPIDALVAQGEITLGKARYFLTGQRSPLVAEIAVRNDPAQPPPSLLPPAFERAPGVYQRSRIEVGIEVPPDARVQGQGAEVRLRGLLHARKAPLRDLALEGTVETLGGTYRIRGKSFEVEAGRVVFTGRTDFDPELDLRAERRVRDVDVIARIRGRASNPKLRLESDPPQPEDDLLALLLFGRTRDELGRAESAAFQAFLAETAGGAALEELRTLTGLPLPLDVFQVRTSEQGAPPTVGLGAYVTRDVFVHFGRGFGETTRSELGLDWRFAPPHWSVETRSTTDQGSSADLIWTYDY